jgi:hypothetical protein
MKKTNSLRVLMVYALISIIYPGWALGQKSTEIEMPVCRPGLQENFLNTVTSIDTDGVKYKLVIIGDLLPVLFVNGKRIEADELKNYSHIIDKLSFVLWQRQKEEANKRNERVEKTRNTIAAELVKEGVVKNVFGIESFLLSQKEFIVNDKNQSLEIFTRFKNKFITSDDQAFYFNKSTK